MNIQTCLLRALVIGWCAAAMAHGVEIVASPPQGVSLSIYDSGFGLVSEVRRANLPKGESRLAVQSIPVRTDPDTVSLSPLGGAQLEIIDQRFEYDLAGLDHLLARGVGRTVTVYNAAGSVGGQLLAVPPAEPGGPPAPVALRGADGVLNVIPDVADVTRLAMPAVGVGLYTQPTLLWRVLAGQEGPQNFRLNYAAGGLQWFAAYEAIMAPAAVEASLSARVRLVNASGGDFSEARIRLVATDKGIVPGATDSGSGSASGQRYAYGDNAPALDRARPGMSALAQFDLPRPVTLRHGEALHVQLGLADRLPVSRFYVYDGVVFDRFQRNRRNDWNYGTECHGLVETYLQFSNSAPAGLGLALPPGVFRLYLQQADGTVDLAGQDLLRAVPVGGLAGVKLGPARGLSGARERTGYSEVVPLHEYEESFEIRLDNQTADPAEIRVVEHLYRWHEYEIVKSDTEYVATAPQTIEFRAEVKPGGKRTLHYTVRYRW